jgi:CRISPR system Cascade subunit CasE
MSIAADQLTLSAATLRIARGGGEAERRSTAPYLIHQAVADLFGERADRGYLYRVTADYPGGAEVLVLSHAPPLPVAELPSPEHRRAQRVRSKPFDPELTAGQRLDFEIRINATQVVTGPDLDRNGESKKHRRDAWEAVWQADKQTPRTPHEVYGEYLQRKLDGVAELLPDADAALARVTERGEVQARRSDRNDVPRFVATNLIGTLRVQNPERFLETIGHGIGRAKAFGCGLLCISRPGTVLARRYPRGADLL